MKFPNAIDLQKAKEVINQTIDKDENVLAEPKRRIGVILLDPDSYHLMVSVWVSAHGFVDTKMKVQENIIEALN